MPIVSIHGVPRSGTSWLGQIFNSHPDVAYRFQPLFAYRFKDLIDIDSSQAKTDSFFDALYKVTDDDFILNKQEVDTRLYPVFIKKKNPEFLVMKMVRYHHLIEKFIKSTHNIKIIGIVRNPCAVINSWLQAPKEFKKEWDSLEEWRYASKKNLNRIEEYNGFEKWKEASVMFLELQEKYPSKFYLLQYEELVDNPLLETEKLFSYVSLNMHSQVAEFIEQSQRQENQDPYAVFKKPGVKDRWKSELNNNISDEIIKAIKGTRLEIFIQ